MKPLLIVIAFSVLLTRNEENAYKVSKEKAIKKASNVTKIVSNKRLSRHFFYNTKLIKPRRKAHQHVQTNPADPVKDWDLYILSLEKKHKKPKPLFLNEKLR